MTVAQHIGVTLINQDGCCRVFLDQNDYKYFADRFFSIIKLKKKNIFANHIMIVLDG
jgi:hypothetical protein